MKGTVGHLSDLSGIRIALTYKTAAEVLDCSASKVQKMVLAGELPYFKVGNETRIYRDDLIHWIEEQRRFHEPKKLRDPNASEVLPIEEPVNGRR